MFVQKSKILPYGFPEKANKYLFIIASQNLVYQVVMQKIPKIKLVETVEKKPNISLLSLRKTLFIRLLCRKFQKSILLKPSKRNQLLFCYRFIKPCLSSCYAEKLQKSILLKPSKRNQLLFCC